LFEELRAIQRQSGYLPAEQLQSLATKIDVPLSQIHGVASFYPHFHLTPPARAEIRICADMSCHLRGGSELKAGVEQAFRGAHPDEVSICDVSCLGRCDQAPALAINDQIYGDADVGLATALVRGVLSSGQLPPERRDRVRTPVASDPYSGSPNYSVVRNFVETRDWQGVLAALKASGLRGMGGAGFPTGNKWELVRSASLSPKSASSKGAAPEIHRLQRRRTRTRYHQRQVHYGGGAVSRH